MNEPIDLTANFTGGDATATYPNENEMQELEDIVEESDIIELKEAIIELKDWNIEPFFDWLNQYLLDKAIDIVFGNWREIIDFLLNTM